MSEAIPRSGRQAHLYRFACFAAIVASSIIWIIDLAYIRLAVPRRSVDFGAYYSAAQALRFDPGANIYSVASLLQVGHAHNFCQSAIPSYLYPPFLAYVMEPFTWMPCASAAVLWFYLNIAVWAVATLIMADLLARRWPERRLAALATALFISFTFLYGLYGLSLGQIHLVILLGVVLALWLIDHGHPWLAGGALAVITVIKILPALLILYYLLRGRWRVVGGAAVTGLALLALMLAISGPATLLGDAQALLALSDRAPAIPINEAIIFAIPHLGWLVAVVAGLLSLGVVWRREGDELLGLGWMLCAMLLLSPLVWSFYLVWLLPAFVACFAALDPPKRLWRGGWRSWAVWAALALLWLLLAIPFALDLRPFATLGLWTITGALYWRSAASAPGVSAKPAPAPIVASGA